MGWLKRLGAALGIPQEEPTEQEPRPRRGSIFSTHDDDVGIDNINDHDQRRQRWEKMQDKLRTLRPKPSKDDPEFGMDSSDGDLSIKDAYQLDQPEVSEALIAWYGAQSFIGHQLCDIIGQHWFVKKAMWLPAYDAVRNGYKVVSEEQKELDPRALKIIKQYDKAFKVVENMEHQIAWGRHYGIRVCFFLVNSTDPLYYEKPFNLDGITPGSYRGIKQVSPYWMSPVLDGASSSDPASLHFYEPTWWIIRGKKYHRSHLIINIPSPVGDILKPSYLYGGSPLTQQIMERVYATERTANEGPLLAMTKRTTVMKTDVAKAFANMKDFMSRLLEWCHLRDNFQVKVIDKEEDEIEIHETSLTDLDSVIMTQAQLVCSIADVPSTRMLNTQPKGFNSTGESEEANYHESLESIQTHAASPLLERHHQLVVRSYVAPTLGVFAISHQWNPLDAQTAKELAETNYIKAQRDAQLVQAGALDGVDVRDRLIADPESDYTGIAPALRPLEPPAGDNNNDEDTPPGDDDAAR